MNASATVIPSSRHLTTRTASSRIATCRLIPAIT
jgi:hypothetical protein